MFDHQHPYCHLVSTVKTWHLGKSPLIIGISGCQGSGKSTLTRFLVEQLTDEKGINVVGISLDDYYLSKDQRSRLASQIHPLFKTRGVPGTHHIDMLKTHIEAVKNQQLSLQLPIFNKTIDQPCSNTSTINQPIDVFIVEGWCLGMTSLSKDQLLSHENELEKRYDASGIWRCAYNQALKDKYQEVWQLFDYLVYLAAPNFDVVSKWRWQQEIQLAQSNNTECKTMSKDDIEQFVMYFQRLTECSLAELPKVADVTFYLNENRDINQMFGLFNNR
jgi:D-glycerate 3-kinase